MTKSTMQRLHDSEINARISSFYDGCWRAELGDDMNAFSEHADVGSFEEAEQALHEMAMRRHPDSDYARGVERER